MPNDSKIFAERYRIRRSVSTGMAQVYEAYDMELDRKVALKLLPPGLHEDAIIAEIFKRETRALRELKHPNIVELIESGLDASTRTPYLVLEWLQYDLSFVINRKPFEGWDAFYESTGRPILQALAFSHSRQIAHRDVKLQNVLIDEGQAPKLADFGIAKLRTDIQPGVTLREFVSRPYAPPEPDDGFLVFARDVYAYAVLVLRCLIDRDLKTYDDVYTSLEEVDTLPEVYAVLGSALARDPTQRPRNAEVLLDKLERIQKPRQASWEVRARLVLSLTKKAADALRGEWPGRSNAELEILVTQDLQVFAVEPYTGGPGTTQFKLLGGRCWYHVVLAQEEDHLVIVNAGVEDELRLEKRRDFAATPLVEFRFGARRDIANAKQDILTFVSAVAEHSRQTQEKQKQVAEDAIFGSWDRILRAKEDLERRREAPIPYDGYERDGSRLRLRPMLAVDDAFAGQFRQIRTGDVIHVQGEIDSVSDEEVILYITTEYGGIPRRGDLLIDVGQSRRALERQRAALDKVRFNRATRSDLRQLVVDPATSREPLSLEVDRFFLDIDESKQTAVAAALGSEDFLLVEGPPGTGKTTFISELILQTLARKADSRILLASQTHVALDNALEGLRRADPSLRLVRVGRTADNRIAAGVADLLIDNLMPRWKEASLRKADEFLRARASALDISIDHLFIARRIRDVRRFHDRRKEIGEASAAVQKRLAEWHAQRPEERTSVAEGTVPVEIADLQASEAAMKKELKELRSLEDVATADLVRLEPDLIDLLDDPAADLDAWEATFRPATTNSQHLDRLIEIRSDWDLRFGKGSEFLSALIASTQVVAGTCVGLASIRGIQEIDFDLCVIDEASKANATEALVPMSMARRWIVVGDERQLPPFVEDELNNRDFQENYDIRPEDLKLTLFSQLSANLPSACKRSLLVQHRMRRAIGTMVSECFYEGRLQNGQAGDALNVFPRPVTWFSTANLPDRMERQIHLTYTNPCESRSIATILREVDRAAAGAERRLRVAVLTAYAGQRTDIMRRLAGERLQWLDIECNTVDAFQGREAHVAIYSVTRCNPRNDLGFLRDLRRLNVALSRARFGLAIVGDHVFARNAPGENPFRRVVEFIERHPDASAVEILR